MSKDLINTPQFIRERQAWYRAGVNAMAGRQFVALIVLGTIVGFTAAAFDLNGSEAVTIMAVGSLMCNAAIGGYLGFTARFRALQGGVQVDQF
jgi:hypothetical protein